MLANIPSECEANHTPFRRLSARLPPPRPSASSPFRLPWLKTNDDNLLAFSLLIVRVSLKSSNRQNLTPFPIQNIRTEEALACVADPEHHHWRDCLLNRSCFASECGYSFTSGYVYSDGCKGAE
ncbi:hypothetical protein AAMO2058_000866000 [Amorphochlora amoebiformis]